MDRRESPIAFHRALSDQLHIRLTFKRDDLLPFPLAGNKYRKLVRELSTIHKPDTTIITNGSVSSNHCRTLAILAAELQHPVHLVLHEGGGKDPDALALLRATNATYDIVPPDQIGDRIKLRKTEFELAGRDVHVVPGGCHSRAGALAYRDAAAEVLSKLQTDYVYLASGTGATQGGIVAGAALVGDRTRVVGVSVAREAGRGGNAVYEAARWAGYRGDRETIIFDDRYRDGGYGLWSHRTSSAVSLGWTNGIPLDPVYTGKAFYALMEHARDGSIPQGASVLFWHTGGLWNAMHSITQAR